MCTLTVLGTFPYIHRAATLLHEYNLPGSGEKIATVASQLRHRTANQRTLCPHLIANDADKADPAHIMKSLAAETINTYPRCWEWVAVQEREADHEHAA